MNHQPDRDRSIDALLRQSLAHGPQETTAACLDAETIAAFVVGGLSKQEMTSTRNHLADCARCQSLLAALARIEPPSDIAKQNTRGWLMWAVPLTAATAVVGIYIAMPRQPVVPAVAPAVSDTARPSVPASPDAPQPPPRASQPPGAVQPSVPAAESGARSMSPQQEKAEADQLAKQTLRQDAPQAVAPEPLRESSNDLRREAIDAFKAPTAPAEPAAPPPEPSQPASAATPQARAVDRVAGTTLRDAMTPGIAARLAERATVDIVSPNPLVRWRLAGSNIQRSTDGGKQWQLQTTGALSALTAGSAVSSSVVWVVGQGGAVFLSTDGQTWRRLPFPESASLSGVRARDANSANVTTSDGRTFSTTDAGATWVPRPLQDF